MASRMVVARQKSATSVGGSQSEHRRIIETEWVKRFGNNEVSRAMLVLLHFSHTFIGGTQEKMLEADRHTRKETTEDADARSARDLRSSQLREAYFLTRDELSVAFGEQALTTCGYANPDRDPVILSQQAKGFADRIRKFEPKREPRIKNYVFDGNEIATRLEGACHEFDAAMSEVTAEMKQTDEARAERNRAVSEFDDALRFGANLTSSLLELLGYAELARKVKPSSRRSGLTVGVEEETPPEELIDDADRKSVV